MKSKRIYEITLNESGIECLTEIISQFLNDYSKEDGLKE